MGTNPLTQFYVVDSDDTLADAPSYRFVDTLYGTWNRLTTFTNNDDGFAIAPRLTPNFTMPWYSRSRGLPFFYLAAMGFTSGNEVYATTNGIVGLDSSTYANTSPNNVALPNGLGQALIAPLWGDFELRTTGDSSKVFVRLAVDTFYVTYYNLFLKGTNGKIRATFQVAITKADTSVTVNYRAFSGTFQNRSAASWIQQRATIGVQSDVVGNGVTYLDRGLYHAVGTGQYAQNLHDQLAVKFLRRPHNQIRVVSINTPPFEHYELSGNTMIPSVTVQNFTDSTMMIYFRNTVKNLGTGLTVYSRSDSLLVNNLSNGTMTGTTMSAIAYGSYRFTTTISSTKLGEDSWSGDNSMSRTFCYFQAATSGGLFEDFSNGIPFALWSSIGALVLPGDSVVYDPEAPRAGISGALVLDRQDINGFYYDQASAGDTMSSAPLNLSGLNNVYLAFTYQRGLKTDSTQAGIMNRVLSGPERTITGSSGVIQQGDSLVIEAIQSTASTLNPAASSWVQIGYIDGGLDLAPQKYRIQLGSAYLHDHFRFRLRLKGHNNSTAFVPVDDNDSWVIDGIQVYGTTSKTDLEVLGADLGNGNYTHVPRNINGLTPHVRITNNGIYINAAVYVARMVIKDQLDRTVYYKTSSFTLPVSRADSTIAMPVWPISGSQGGVFSVFVSLEQLIFDYNHANDTNTFVRKLFIDDVYALDDAVPDTAGTMTAAHTEFYYDFTPFASDSLRGTDFYLLNPFGGSMSWSLQIKHDTNTIANRAFGVNATSSGFARGTFPPVNLTGGVTYRMHYTMTTGSGLGGDASQALVWPTPDNSAYQALHPELVPKFFEPGQVDYVSAAGTTNGAGGGLLLPMFRLVFKGSNTFLPVELINFNGSRLANGSARLDWKTAKEQDVFEFRVERKSGSDWLSVGSSLPKAGLNGGTYSIVDVNAPAGEVTYRLIEHDLNGSKHELGAATINSADALSGEMTLYPNPATGIVRVGLQGIADVQSVRVVDLLGRAVFEDHAVTGGTYQFDASKLATGIYEVEVATGSQVVRKRLTLVR